MRPLSRQACLFEWDAGACNQVTASIIGLSLNQFNKIPNRTGVVVFADNQIIGSSQSTGQ